MKVNMKRNIYSGRLTLISAFTLIELLIVVAIIGVLSAIAQEIGEATKSHIEQVGLGKYKIGGILVDGKSREIRFPGKVNMNEGLIEVIICTERGKLHESVFVTKVRPMDLHTTLLLIGLHPGSNPGRYLSENLEYRPKGWDKPPGDRVDIFVSWKSTGNESRKERAGVFVMDRRTKRTLKKIDWVFTGSLVKKNGVYMGDEVGSIVTNYHDQTAVIDNPLTSGRLDDYIYANTSAIPPVGTAVEIHIIPVKKTKG